MFKAKTSAIFILVFSVFGAQSALAETKTAIFAGGCFWCMEKPFEKIDGVSEVRSGFAGGTLENPTYKQVTRGNTGHYEVVEVVYDDEKASYQDLLEVYWSNVDPLDPKGQFCDKGSTYRTAVFYNDEDEFKLAVESIKAAEKILKKDIVTELLPAATFYPAEDYHQDFYKTNETKYKFYRWKCGRDARLDDLWGESARTGVSLFE